MILRIELGLHSHPLDHVLHIARALDVPPAELMPDTRAED